MARQISQTPNTATELLQAELERFAQSNDLLSVLLIKSLCQSFQAMALKYYRAGTTAAERLSRLGEISQLFREVGFTDDQGRVFTIASANAGMPAQEAYDKGAEGCIPPDVCIDRNCIPPIE